MIRTLSNSLLAVSLIALAAVTSSPLVAAEKATAKAAAEKAVAKPEAEKTVEKSAEKPVEPAAPVAPAAPETPAATAPVATTVEKVPSSYKAGNLEISSVSVTEKGGTYEIYLTIKNNGKADDAITSAELTEGTGEIVTVSKVTTKEVSNQDAIKKAQEEANKAMQEAGVPPKEGEKAEPPKRVEPPKPEYKDVTKEVEGGMITLPADKTTKLEGGEARLKLTGYKAAKSGGPMSIMLHFRSSPNVTVKAKAGGGGSLLNKLFGQ